MSACQLMAASDPVPADRLPYGGTWEGAAGVVGGIPTGRTQYGATLPTTASAAQINAAVANCPGNQYVQLAAGTFSNLGANDIIIAKSGVTLRGAVDAMGLPATTLVFESGRNIEISAGVWDVGSPSLFTTLAVTGGANRGSTSLAVSATPTGLSAGRLMWITAPKNAPTIDGGGWSDWFGARPFSQVVEVTAVSGNVVSFTPAINADYISGLAVQIHYRGAGSQIDRSGVENLSLTNVTGSFGSGRCFDISGANQCWVLNCRAYGLAAPSALNAFVYMYACSRVEIRRCDFSHFTSYGSSTYCLASVHCSGLLVEDNIFHDAPNVWPMMATSGSVFAYNYFFNEPYQLSTYLSQIVFHHGSHNHYNLFEGNWLATHYNDATTTGNYSHSRNSLYFRQRLLGWDEHPLPSGKTDNLHAISFENHHDNVTVAGCVMGMPGKLTQYDKMDGKSGYPFSVFNADSVTRATLVRKANYNTIDSSVPASEALGAGEVLATSYIHASKPSWFGNRPWPWCDPLKYGQSNASTNLPAAYRFAYRMDPPADGPDLVAPTAPSGLAAVVVGTNRINLTWAASTDAYGVTGYLVERQSPGNPSFVQVGTVSTTSYSDVGLTAGTSYSYRVRATDGAGNLSSYAGPVSGVTWVMDSQPPTAPSGLAASASSSSQVNLTWVAASDNVGVTGYRVERSQGAGSTAFSQVGTATGTSFNDTGLSGLTVYNYRVLAVDQIGNQSGYSGIASATTAAPPPDQTPPTAPLALEALTVSSNEVKLSWTDSTDNVGVTGYAVEMAQGAGSTSFSQIGFIDLSSITPGNLLNTRLNVTGLAPSTTYGYRVRAKDAAGNVSAYSAVKTAVTTSVGARAGLVLAMGFEEGSGTTTSDASGTGNNGTLTGTSWITTGRFGKALSFNGSSARVTVPDSASLDLTTGMTLEAWVNPATLGGWRDVVFKSVDMYYLMVSSGQSDAPATGGTYCSSPLLGTTPVPLNSWSHLAATYDGAAVRLYVNGVQVASRAQTGLINVSTASLTIGGDTTFGQYFQGLIDEVRVYNRALSASEIQADMNSPVRDTVQPVKPRIVSVNGQ